MPILKTDIQADKVMVEVVLVDHPDQAQRVSHAVVTVYRPRDKSEPLERTQLIALRELQLLADAEISRLSNPGAAK